MNHRPSALRRRVAQLARSRATARIAARRSELERTVAILGAAVTAMDEGVIALDPSARVVFFNPAASRILGVAPDAADWAERRRAVLTLADGTTPADLPLERAAAGETFGGLELLVRRGPASDVVVACEGRPLTGGGGEPLGGVVVLRDVTEQRRLEASHQRAKEDAERAAAARSELLSNVSHEVRSPMSGIIGMTELLLETELTRHQREYLGLVKSSADALLDVINGVLDHSKIEAGKMTLDPEIFDPRECIGDAALTLALRAHQKRIELACRVDDAVPEEVVGDKGRLRQVIVNLLSNAVKYTERGEVVVDVAWEPQAEGGGAVLHITVSDTGPGIPAAMHATIFESFTQAVGTSRRLGGTGLGLTIAARLVALMGGHIWLESEMGRGSRFHFTVHLDLPAVGAPRARTRPVGPARFKGLPVLVADDSATTRRILGGMLENWGGAPAFAASGEETLGMLRQARDRRTAFPLVLLDAHMPETNGLALAKKLKEDPSLAGAVILMLSPDHSVGDAARTLGVEFFVTKPVKRSDLLAAIDRALGAPVLPTRAPEVAPTPVATRPLHILLAEDNPVNKEVTSRTLLKRGHRVVIVENGAEALRALEDGPFDLVLMDVQMPTMNGLDATRELRRREGGGRRTPVVALTAHALVKDREECLAAGMDAYLSKPVQPDDLHAMIAAVTADGAGATAPAPTPPPSEVVFDLDALLARCDGDAELMSEVAGIFLASVPRMLGDVSSAAADGDVGRLRTAAHALRGSISYFGASSATHAAQRLASVETTDELAGRPDLLQELRAQVNRLCVSLVPLAERAAAP